MSTPRIAFFGATGGCACAALALALKAGYSCSALVRNTTKLTTILASTHSIDAATYIASGALTVVEGDIGSQDAVLSTIAGPASHPADYIVAGIGGTPTFQWSLVTPVTITDLTICERATRAILAAVTTLRDATPSYRPTITVISTTGTSKRRDVPLLMYPMYHWLLQVPHVDKRKMEGLLFENQSVAGKSEGGRAYDFVVVRPTMLTDGECRGLAKLRVGWENPDTTGEGPQMGYTVSRKDVGNWIFEAVVKGGREGKYANKCVSLTY